MAIASGKVERPEKLALPPDVGGIPPGMGRLFARGSPLGNWGLVEMEVLNR